MEPLNLPDADNRMTTFGTFLALPFRINVSGVWLAGGAVKDNLEGTKPADYDIFAASPEALWEFEQDQFLGKDNWKKTHDSLHCRSYLSSDGDKVQLIYNPDRMFPTMQALLETFPFHLNQFAYDGKKLVMSELGDQNRGQRVVTINRINPKHYVQALERCVRCAGYGYKIPASTLTHILDGLRLMTPENYLADVQVAFRSREGSY